MLDSALNRPKQLLNFGKPSIFELAAAYAFGIVRNHPFLDGNKRIGFMSAYTFLGINGYELQAPEEETVIMTRDLAAGKIEEAAYARFDRMRAEWLTPDRVETLTNPAAQVA